MALCGVIGFTSLGFSVVLKIPWAPTDKPGKSWKSKGPENQSMHQAGCSFLNRFKSRRYFLSIVNELSHSDSDHGFYQRYFGEIHHYYRTNGVSLCLGYWKGNILWVVIGYF